MPRHKIDKPKSLKQATCAAGQVAALTVGPEYNAHFVRMYKIFILQLREVVPPTTHLPTAYEAGGDDEQAFVQNLALFFTAFFRVRCSAQLCYTP